MHRLSFPSRLCTVPRCQLKAEIIIHKSLRHKHVVRFDTYFEDDDNVYIVLDLCENQSLMELLRRRKRLTEEETKYYIMQILEAIKYLHVNLVIHRCALPRPQRHA